MNSQKENNIPAEAPVSERQEAVHIHGPSCNHGHHQAQKPITRLAPKVGRNDPCPCGSQKKFKKCCG